MSGLLGVGLVLAGAYVAAYAVATVVVAVLDALGWVYSAKREARKNARQAPPKVDDAAHGRESKWRTR